MYLKHPIKVPTGKTKNSFHKNLLTGETNAVEVPITDYIQPGKLDNAIWKAIDKPTQDMLIERGFVFKTEKEAYTVPESPEGIKLVDKKKDDETKDE